MVFSVLCYFVHYRLVLSSLLTTWLDNRRIVVLLFNIRFVYAFLFIKICLLFLVVPLDDL